MKKMNKKRKEEAGEKTEKEDARLVELKKQIDEDMQKLNFQIKLDRSMALDRLVGVEKSHRLRDALLQTIANQKGGNIKITFAALDWIYRYYYHMNKVLQTGLDDFLDLDLE